MRRKIILSAALTAIAAFAFAPAPAPANGDRVSVNDGYTPGTIVIRTGERRLYYFVGVGEAIRYPVGVGRAGMQWSGTAVVNGKTSSRRGRRQHRSGATTGRCRASFQAVPRITRWERRR